MSWKKQLKGDSLSWLLETDSPDIHYLALRDLVGDTKEAAISAAQKEAHESGPIATILDHMSSEGYWAKEGPGYLPKPLIFAASGPNLRDRFELCYS